MITTILTLLIMWLTFQSRQKITQLYYLMLWVFITEDVLVTNLTIFVYCANVNFFYVLNKIHVKMTLF